MMEHAVRRSEPEAVDPESKTRDGPDACPQAGQPVIDIEVLQRFTLGNPDLDLEVLKLFAEHLPVPLAVLAPAASVKDWAYATHTIKGSARAVGARRLAAAAAEAEAASDAERPSHIARLRREAEAAITFVSRLTATADRYRALR